MLLDRLGYRIIPSILLLLLISGFLFSASGQVAVTLATGVGSPGSTVNLNISVNTTGTQPASLQWAINYSTSQISSIAVTNGPVATNAGKTVSCNQLTPGSINCIVFGLNQSSMANGMVAVAAVTIAPGTTSTSSVIAMANAVASTGTGLPLTATATGSIVTINQPVGTTTISITTNPPGLQILVDGTTLTAPQNFQWAPGSQHTINASSPQGSGVARYLFSGWSDGGPLYHTITTPSSPTTYTAGFNTQYLLSTSASPAGTGSVQANPSSADGYYNSGTIVQLTAVPLSGFQFSSWSGGISAGTALTTVSMSTAVSAVANFNNSSNTCTYTLSRTTFSAASDGDFGRVQVTTGETCNWNASSNSPWLTINSGMSGTGNGSVGFTIAANPGASPRSGTLLIGGQSFMVTQADFSCGSNIAVSNAVLVPLSASASEVTLTISAPSSCQWSTSVPSNWIAITSGSTGSGSGNVQLSIATNQTSNPRTASVQIGGTAVPLIQLGTTTPQFYSDVPPSYLFVQNINLLVLNGILSGCTPVTFCPEVNATRADAAPLIIRALFGDNFAYSPAPYFTDVPANHPFFKYIQRMRELEITVGCTATEYCPNGLVTRGQMAAFLMRAKLGGAGIPVAGGSTVGQTVYPLAPYFQDVPKSHIFFPFIQKIKQLGITFGCTSTQYCAENLTTRGQLAAFLTRGFLTP